MNNALAFQIALRYLFSKKSTNAINIITWVAMAGMAIGTMALLLVLSVFNGFEGLVLSLYNQFTPDIQITPAQGKVFVISPQQLQKIQGMKDVVAVTKVLQEKALLKYQDREYIATVKGVDDTYLKVNPLNKAITKGSFLLNDNSLDYVVLGSGVKAALGANLSDGINAISIFLPERKKQSGGLIPTDAFNRKFIFPSGVISVQQEFDYEFVYVSIDFLRETLSYKDEISALELKLTSNANITSTKNKLLETLGSNLKIKDRYEQDETLFKVMNTEKIVAYGIFAFVIIIISFNITGSLSMIALEKSKDISVLKTMGANNSFIKKIFLLEGVLSSLIGCGVGIFLALAIGLIQIKFKLIKMNATTMVVDSYPVVFKLESFIVVIIMVIGIGFLASVLPALRASNTMLHLNQK